MSHVFQISDDLYAKLEAYAAQHEQTPESLFLAWVNDLAQSMERPGQVGREAQDGRQEEILKSPLFQIAGMFAIGEPGWADRHDEYLAEAYADNHADEE